MEPEQIPIKLAIAIEETTRVLRWSLGFSQNSTVRITELSDSDIHELERARDQLNAIIVSHNG